MDLLLSVIFAWIAAISVVLLSIIYILRKIAGKKTGTLLYRVNKSLRKYHKPLGIIAIVTGIIHGLYSSIPLFSINIGTILIIFIILLGISFIIRKNMKGKWAFAHRFMALTVCILLIIHIIEVNGFVGIDGLQYALEKDGYLVSSDINSPVSPTSTTNEIIEETMSDETLSPETSTTEPTEEASVISETPTETTDSLVTDANHIFADDVVLQDGIYYGTADAYGPNLETEVVVEDGFVTEVNIISHNEKNSSIYGTAMDQVPDSIIEEQTTQVDSVSGATYTSYGIMMSVEDALQEAVLDGDLPGVEMPSISRKH